MNEKWRLRVQMGVMIACVLCVAGIELFSGIARYKVRRDMELLQTEHTRFWIKHYELRGDVIKLFETLEKGQSEELKAEIERMKFEGGWIEPCRIRLRPAEKPDDSEL